MSIALAALGVALVFLITIASYTTVPLSWFDRPVSALISQHTDAAVDVQGLQLSWSPSQPSPVLGIGRVQLDDNDQFKLTLGDVYIEPSAAAFWRHGDFAISALSIGSVDVVSASPEALPSPTSFAVDTSRAQASTSWLTYLRRIDIQNISIQTQQSSAEEIAQEGASYILIFREEGSLHGVVDLAYARDAKPSRLNGRMTLKFGQGGAFDLTMENVNPRSVGNFSRFLAPLRAISLPVNGHIAGDLDATGAPLKAQAEISVLPGEVSLQPASVPFKAIDFTIDADFTTDDFTISRGYFDIGGFKGKLTGALDYESSASGQISLVHVGVTATDVYIDEKGLFAAPVAAQRITADVSFDVVAQALSIEALDIQTAHGSAKTSGLISKLNQDPTFDIVTRFSAMPLEGVMALWPVAVGGKTRNWVNANMLAGQLTGGSLTLHIGLDELVNRERSTPLREDALDLSLDFSKADVRALKTWPPVQGISASLSVKGKSFSMVTQGGQLVWDDQETTDPAAAPSVLSLGSGRMQMANFRLPGAPATMQFDVKGEISPVLQALREPPMWAMRNSNFDVERVQGHFDGRLNLSLGLNPKQRKLPLRYTFEGGSEDLSVDGRLGRFALSDGRVNALVSEKGLAMMGRARANQVDVGFEWRQPFRKPNSDEQVKPGRLALAGNVTAQDLQQLGFDWAGLRMDGTAHVNVLVEGPLEKPSAYRVEADFEQARLMPIPLAYEKPVGQAARIIAALEMDAAGKIKNLRTRGFVDGEELLKASLAFEEGVLTTLDMKPVSLGRTQNLVVNLMSDRDGRQIEVSADQLDALGMFARGNPEIIMPPRARGSFFDFLGENATIEVQSEKVVGGYQEELLAMQLFVARRDDLFEKVTLQGLFDNGSELLGSLERTDNSTRSYNIQTENTSGLFHLLGLMEGVQGGAMMLQGHLYDDMRDTNGDYKQSSGRFDMVSFRARKVPTLAKILSVGSFKGFADTLNGDGIQFDYAEFKFSLVDDLLRIKGGRAYGSAIGFTSKGDYNVATSEFAFGGTVVPAYTVNSLFSKIPILGRLLTGRKGEGLLGLGYRVTGQHGEPSVLVNPLSILTPGIFRRIFEVGIGLRADGTPQRLEPSEQAPE